MESEGTGNETIEMNLAVMGSLICDRAFTLSRRVNEELLEPISKWLDDPHWMERFKVYEEHIPNWLKYKQRQRQMTKQQKQLAAQRLRHYWQAIRRKKRFLKEVSLILNRTSARGSPNLQIAEDYLTPIVAPFSPPEQKREDTQQKFRRLLRLTISDLLPWKLLINSELKGTKRLKDLKQFYPEDYKRDIASKLIHLLQMEQEGKLALKQEGHFAEITIEPIEIDNDSAFTIKDQHGEDYCFDWRTLTDTQKNKVIADIKEHRVICKTA